MDQSDSNTTATKQEAVDVNIDSNGRLVFPYKKGKPAFVRNVISTSPGTPFPVELQSFGAEVKDDGILLKWTTATEVNNYGFEIYRAINVDTQQNYFQLGFVQGYGNSNSPKNYEFLDKGPPAANLIYRLKQIDTDGSYEFYDKTIHIDNSVTAITETNPGIKFSLAQNYPNPFNPATTIKYMVPSNPESNKQYVILSIYDVLGNELSKLVDEEKSAGVYEANFNSANLASGIYYYKLKIGGFVSVKKMVVLK